MAKRVVISLIIFLACFLLIGCFSPVQNEALGTPDKDVSTGADVEGEDIDPAQSGAEGDQKADSDSATIIEPQSLPIIDGNKKDKESPENSGTSPKDVNEITSKAMDLPQEAKVYCTLSISCATIWDNLDKFNENKKSLLPEDGYILAPVKVEFTPGETGFDVLLRECMSREIHMEYNTVPLYKSKYVKGIGNIYEFDCGELSGWIYRVNDKIFNTGSSNYQLEEGDIIQWVYSCDLGRDVGFQAETEGGEN